MFRKDLSQTPLLLRVTESRVLAVGYNIEAIQSLTVCFLWGKKKENFNRELSLYDVLSLKQFYHPCQVYFPGQVFRDGDIP